MSLIKLIQLIKEEIRTCGSDMKVLNEILIHVPRNIITDIFNEFKKNNSLFKNQFKETGNVSYKKKYTFKIKLLDFLTEARILTESKKNIFKLIKLLKKRTTLSNEDINALIKIKKFKKNLNKLASKNKNIKTNAYIDKIINETTFLEHVDFIFDKNSYYNLENLSSTISDNDFIFDIFNIDTDNQINAGFFEKFKNQFSSAWSWVKNKFFVNSLSNNIIEINVNFYGEDKSQHSWAQADNFNDINFYLGNIQNNIGDPELKEVIHHEIEHIFQSIGSFFIKSYQYYFKYINYIKSIKDFDSNNLDINNAISSSEYFIKHIPNIYKRSSYFLAQPKNIDFKEYDVHYGKTKAFHPRMYDIKKHDPFYKKLKDIESSYKTKDLYGHISSDVEYHENMTSVIYTFFNNLPNFLKEKVDKLISDKNYIEIYKILLNERDNIFDDILKNYINFNLSTRKIEFVKHMLRGIEKYLNIYS